MHDLQERTPVGKVYPDPQAIKRAAEVLREAKRPMIVIGGGVITAEAFDEVVALAETWKIPVVTTWNGKGGFPEDHALFAGSVGQTGTLCGNDGDFLMNPQEIAVCVTNNIPVVFLIQNNAGYMSIRGGQRKQTSRHIGSEFNLPNGEPYSPDFAALGRSFGIKSFCVNSNEELEPILQQALDANEKLEYSIVSPK